MNELLAQIATPVSIVATGVTVVAGIQSLRKESVLRRNFDWTSQAFLRETDEVIRVELDKVRKDYYAQLLRNESEPRWGYTAPFVSVAFFIFLTATFALIRDPVLSMQETFAILAFLAVLVAIPLSVIVKLESSRQNELEKWRGRLLRAPIEKRPDSIPIGKAIMCVCAAVSVITVSYLAATTFGVIVFKDSPDPEFTTYLLIVFALSWLLGVILHKFLSSTSGLWYVLRTVFRQDNHGDVSPPKNTSANA